jgi:chemotaxis protein CheX
MIEDLEQLIRVAVAEVFGTMLNIEVKGAELNGRQTNGEEQIASSVGFIGRLTGVVYLYSSGTFAKGLACRMLGMEPGEISGNEMVNDVMGELTNMVVGHLKSRLSDRGMPCVLTIPSIVRGNQFSIEPVSSSERRVFAFRCEVNQLIVEVLIKPSTKE